MTVLLQRDASVVENSRVRLNTGGPEVRDLTPIRDGDVRVIEAPGDLSDRVRVGQYGILCQKYHHVTICQVFDGELPSASMIECGPRYHLHLETGGASQVGSSVI